LRNEALERAGLARLHQRQTTRALRIVAKAPWRINFFWADCPKRTPRTAADVLRQLKQPKYLTSVHLEEDLALLSVLPADEPLVWLGADNLRLCATIWEQCPEGSRTAYRPKPVSAPMLILTPGPHLPEIKGAEPRNTRAKRSDNNTEASAYLKTVPVYRYIDPKKAKRRRVKSETESAV
jgi:hypothetical protein